VPFWGSFLYDGTQTYSGFSLYNGQLLWPELGGGGGAGGAGSRETWGTVPFIAPQRPEADPAEERVAVLLEALSLF